MSTAWSISLEEASSYSLEDLQPVASLILRSASTQEREGNDISFDIDTRIMNSQCERQTHVTLTNLLFLFSLNEHH